MLQTVLMAWFTGTELLNCRGSKEVICLVEKLSSLKKGAEIIGHYRTYSFPIWYRSDIGTGYRMCISFMPGFLEFGTCRCVSQGLQSFRGADLIGCFGSGHMRERKRLEREGERERYRERDGESGRERRS